MDATVGNLFVFYLTCIKLSRVSKSILFRLESFALLASHLEQSPESSNDLLIISNEVCILTWMLVEEVCGSSPLPLHNQRKNALCKHRHCRGEIHVNETHKHACTSLKWNVSDCLWHLPALALTVCFESSFLQSLAPDLHSCQQPQTELLKKTFSFLWILWLQAHGHILIYLLCKR